MNDLHITTKTDAAQIKRANASDRQPVVFIHGLWLLPNSWERWASLFETQGLIALTPGWPDDPETVDEANRDPKVMANKTIEQVVEHYTNIIDQLEKPPVLVGHSFGGLISQILAGRNLARATVAIDPAAFQGVLPLPLSALKSASPVLGNLANRHKAVPLTFSQFQYAFANAVSEDEARELYDTYAVPAPGKPLFQAAAANFNPWSEDKVDTSNPARGPLLIISGELDHTVPHAVAKAAFNAYKSNHRVITEFHEMAGRGHSLVIDKGWHEVADVTLAFIRRFL